MAAGKTPSQPQTPVDSAINTSDVPTQNVTLTVLNPIPINPVKPAATENEAVISSATITVITANTFDATQESNLGNQPAEADATNIVTQTADEATNTEVTEVVQAQTEVVPVIETVAPTPEELSAAIMKTYGLDDLDYTECKKLMNAMQVGAQNRKAVALRALAEKFAAEAQAIDATERDLAIQLKATRNNKGLRQGGARLSEHALASTDKDGQRPKIGAAYRHPTTGETWKKLRHQGLNKQIFVQQILEGRTWADLEHLA